MSTSAQSETTVLSDAVRLFVHRTWSSLTSPRVILFWLAIWLSGILTYDYYVRVESPSIERRISLHYEIVTGSAPYPYRYRILLPFTAEVVARLIQKLPTVRSRPSIQPLSYSKRAFTLAYSSANITALVILFVCLGELVWRMFTYRLALFGISVSALLVNFTFRDHYFHPWSLWEGAFFALGLLLIHRQQYWLFSGVSLLALINRETSLFLLLAFLFCTLPQKWSKHSFVETMGKRDLRFAFANLVIWGVGFLVLHQIVGYSPPTFFVETALNGNRANLKYAALLNFLLFGFVWPLVLRGIFVSPMIIRRSAMMLPAYFGLLLVIGFWWEIRYWITVIPIVIPALIAAVASVSLRTSKDYSTD